MKRELIKTELEYILSYSQYIEDENTIRLFDNKFKNLYATNITLLTKNIFGYELVDTINKKVRETKKEKRTFLNFEVQRDLEYSIINKLEKRPHRIDKFNYMVIKTEKYKDIVVNNALELRKVCTEDEYDEIVKINLLDNAAILGYKYAKERIDRKVEVYKDTSNELTTYLCYKGNKAIGSAEMIIKGQCAKIEDFGVLRKYRNNGYGTFILRELLKNCYENDVKTAYVITEKNSSVNKMYEKLGFNKIDTKTQLIFSV